MPKTAMVRWAVENDSTTRLDGRRNYFKGGLTELFMTRRECLTHIKEKYGYIAKRKDLRVEPHCWRVPKPRRVMVTIEPYKKPVVDETITVAIRATCGPAGPVK